MKIRQEGSELINNEEKFLSKLSYKVAVYIIQEGGS